MSGMNLKQPNICVCICTYKRPELLRNALDTLRKQRTAGLFTFSVVIVDNDVLESAREQVHAFSASYPDINVEYHVEPQQNIAMARNRAIAAVRGEFVAFMDDDEFPSDEWLLLLWRAIQKYGADGILGPVEPFFSSDAPRWVIDGRFYHRPAIDTGATLDWQMCRTGNVLFDSALFVDNRSPFRPECLTGEDQDLFQRLIAKGHRFVWCSEAAVYEVVPRVRWSRRFLIRRAMFRGIFSVRNRRLTLPGIMKSLAAALVLIVATPVALCFGQSRFMQCAFKLSYHTGRVAAALGLNPIKTAYVTE